MVVQADPHAARAEGAMSRLPRITVLPEGRMRGCPPPERSRRMGPLLLGLGLGAVLWLAIGLFSWQFFR